MPSPSETTLPTAHRHVSKGRALIARQQALTAELGRGRHDPMLPEANKLLEEMRKLQARMEEHLARQLAESVGGEQVVAHNRKN